MPADQEIEATEDGAASGLAVGAGFGWITVELSTRLENGRYEIQGCDDHFDGELQRGQIEIYDHPERGPSYWDDCFDDGSDFAGHASTFWLLGQRVRRLPNDPITHGAKKD